MKLKGGLVDLSVMIKEKSNDDYPPSTLRMVILCLVLVSPSFLFGLNLSYPAIAIPQMGLNVDQASWFGSVSVYISPLSSILVGLNIDSLGRRKTLLFSILPSIAGWSLLYWSKNIELKLLGQLLNGLAAGAAFYPVQVYIGECVMIDNVLLRNKFLSWIGSSVSFGSAIMLLMANIINYNQICLVCLILSVTILLVFFHVIPESPSWLYGKGRREAALQAEKKLGIRQPILYESSVESHRRAYTKQKLSWSAFKASVSKIKRKDVYKPLLILSVSASLAPLSGLMTSATYMIDIIDGRTPGAKNVTSVPLRPENNFEPDQVTVSKMVTRNQTSASTTYVSSDSNKYSLISGLVMFVGSLISSIILPRLGIKKTIVLSNLCAVIGLLMLAYAYNKEPSSYILLIRIIAVSLLAFLLGIIIGPIAACAGDIFPPDAKGFASLLDLFGNFSTATANKFYPYMCLTIGSYTYGVYAVLSILGAIYVHIMTPEVVGKTLEEIRNNFLIEKTSIQ